MKFSAIFLPLLCLLISCELRPAEDRIRIPQVTASFYENAASRLGEALEKDPNNVNLVELQLSYYEKLDWPPEADKSVERAKLVLELEPIVAKKYADFYVKNDQFEALLNLRDELGERYETPDWMWHYQINAANKVGRFEEAIVLLRSFFTSPRSKDDHFFGGKEYLVAGDSLLGLYHLQQVKKEMQDNSNFVRVYVPLAYHNGAYNEVLNVINDYDDKTVDITLPYKALSLYALGESDEAKKLLWSIPVKANLETLHTWYLNEQRLDSSVMCLERILVTNPNDLDVLLRKGKIDDRRGWVYRAASAFNQILEIDSTHVEAKESLELVNRKIAYLRRIREADQDIPTINLNSKKAIQ